MKNQMVDDETGKAVEDDNQPKSKAGARAPALLSWWNTDDGIVSNSTNK